MLKEIDHITNQNQEKLKEDFLQKHKQLIEVTQVFKQALELCKEKEYAPNEVLWNVGIYINMAALDLSTLVQQLLFERDDWTRRQIGRHAVLTIYESAKDLTGLLGKNLRDPLSSVGLLQRFDKSLRENHKELNNFWEEHQIWLRDIRCISAGHRDLDGLLLLNSIETLDIAVLNRL